MDCNRHRPTQMTKRPVATLPLHQLIASPYCCGSLKAKVKKNQLGNTRWSFCCHGCSRQGRIMHTRGLFSHLVSVFASHRYPQHAVSVAERMKNNRSEKHLPFFPPVASWLSPCRSTRSIGMQHVPLIKTL